MHLMGYFAANIQANAEGDPFPCSMLCNQRSAV